MDDAQRHVGHQVSIHTDVADGSKQGWCDDCKVEFDVAQGQTRGVEATHEYHDEAANMDLSTYVDKAMYEAAPMKQIKVSLISATPDPLGAIAAACRMYEGKPTYDLTEVTDAERADAWIQVNSTHLKAPLEFVDLHFFIEGVTRAFTHQMVRQRTAVYAQESMRFAVKEEIAARPGPMISGDSNMLGVWRTQMADTWDRYKYLIGQGVPAEEARGLLPHDTLTRLNYKTNLRNLLEHAGNRLCTQAQFEWRAVLLLMVQAIADHTSVYLDPTAAIAGDEEGFGAPSVAQNWQWKHITDSKVFKPVCFQLGHCPFNADFDRGCTIRERVEAGKFDEINPEEYMSDPTAGWIR